MTAATWIATDAKRSADRQVRIDDAALPISPENLNRLIAELVDNAFKFSEYGTPVIVAVKGQYTVEITDHGRGLSAEQIASIGAYMQFCRRQYEQRLAELHNGDLTVTSTREPEPWFA